ncbi:MAG: DUF4349 domain-containing protein [Candidatus Shapirobacteria bacterium]|jgi:hypothetical protein
MINWLKKNWALAILIIIVLSFLKERFLGSGNLSLRNSASYDMAMGGVAPAPAAKISSLSSRTDFVPESIAPSDAVDRMVIQDTSLSLVVKDVSTVISQIETAAKGFGGYLVNSYLSKPEAAASGNIVIRVPEGKRTEALSALKGFAIKVVSESVSGTDVTDEYVDLQARLDILYKTKAKFDEISAKAYTVNDLLEVNRELINVQSQIDSIKGRQKYYEQSAKLSKITVYLSTDEMSLPYAPTNEWRPAVIFKEAVRSLVGALRNIGTLAIWLVVFSPVIIPAVLLYRWYRSKKK